MRLRSELFKSIIRREISFFDEKRHSSEKLSAHLATNPSKAGKAFGLNLAVASQALFTFIVGMILGFSSSWKLALVVLAAIPLSIAMGIIQNQAFLGK
jgi:ABC-type multidrug transport system fused ATPase/permease subunit